MYFYWLKCLKIDNEISKLSVINENENSPSKKLKTEEKPRDSNENKENEIEIPKIKEPIKNKEKRAFGKEIVDDMSYSDTSSCL